MGRDSAERLSSGAAARARDRPAGWRGTALRISRPPRWSLSLLLLVAVNTAPAAAVLVFRWSAADLVLLYWTENLIVGAFNVLRMAFARSSGGVGRFGKLFAIPFFLVHYGVFCLVHGLFLVFFFGLGGAGDVGTSPAGGLALFDLPAVLLHAAWSQPPPGFRWVLLGLMVSHGISFVQHDLLGGEREFTTVSELMMQPYRRIVVLHVAILLGGVLIVLVGSPIPLLLILVLAKVVLDVVLHLREHRRPASKATPR